MKRLFYLLITVLALATACKNKEAKTDKSYDKATIEAESKKANVFFDKAFNEMLDRSPMRQSYLGIKKDQDKWDNISDEYAAQTLEIKKKQFKYLTDSLDLNKLDKQAKISYSLFKLNVENDIESWPYRFNNYPVNQEDGLHTEVPTLLINVHLIDSLKDAKAYISRLGKVNVLFDQLIVNLQTRENKGIIAPKFTFPKVIEACQNIVKGAPFDKSKNNSPLLDDFNHKINSLKGVDNTTKEDLKKQGREAMLASVKPAYDKLIAYLTKLETKASDSVGAWRMPDGDAYYKMACRHTTTTDMTPEEIYQFGVKEVARIHGEIKEIMKKVNFKNDNVTDFLHYMASERKESYYENTQKGRDEYLADARRFIDQMRGRLDEIFIAKPKAPLLVIPVEKYRESSAGSAFYEQPSMDGKRPGRFYVNQGDMNGQPKYQLEALAYHEAIPGHHMQIAIAQELTGIPQFRKIVDYTAYVEGWALYCEKLPKEMGGFYQDPYSDFGRLSMELLRAARCVVDPGIHYKHWTREQAIKYFTDNTAEAPTECVHAIERYIVWPSQATAYKIGMNKIMDLREKAKKELGPKFNIREFHDIVLTSGAVPMGVLEDLVNEWIASKKK